MKTYVPTHQAVGSKERPQNSWKSFILCFYLAVALFFVAFNARAQYPAGSPVAINGKLKLVGNKLSNECGNPVQLRGMSTHGPQWFPQCYTGASLDALTRDWGIDVFRLAMYVQEGGYVNDPTRWKAWIDNMVDECGRRGIYCLIDWHVLNPGNPSANINEARDFWSYMSAKHAGKKHVLYEICNEPNGVSWEQIKTYAQDIIPRIRANDPNTIIIVGTPTWSQDVDAAANSPLVGTNLMYTLHFYAGTHTQWLRDKANAALSKGMALFITEFGTSQASGDGGPYLEETQRWMDWAAANNISWVNWSFADKTEVSAALTPGACGGNWNSTTPSGAFVKQRILSPADNFNCTNGGTNGIVSGQIYRVVSRLPTAHVLDVSGCSTAEGANVHMWSWWGGNCQRWKVETTSNGYYKLTAVNSGKVLNVADNGARGRDSNVNQQAWTGGAWQEWQIAPTTDGYYSIKSRLNSAWGLNVANCSEAQGANVNIWDYSGAACHQWKFELVGAAQTTLATTKADANAPAQLLMYPNPASESVKLTWSGIGTKSVTISLLNALGAVVHHQVVTTATSYQLNTVAFAPGLYTVTVQAGQFTLTKKLAIMR